ncbi:MAG: 2-amino-4-hydroxy-6-hydroxymethyldihydropteridine diphosphokinase [Ignavibacteria bacterium]
MFEYIYLGLGSNKGDRLHYMKMAVDEISADKITRAVAISSVYETEPYGCKDQNYFLNAVIRICSSREPEELYTWIKGLEKKIGRTDGPRWGPREIDIDLLFFGSKIFSDEKLTVPHKEVLLRDFVLLPLLELSPEFIHPGINKKIKEIDTSRLEKLIIKKYPVNLLNYPGEINGNDFNELYK